MNDVVEGSEDQSTRKEVFRYAYWLVFLLAHCD